MATYNIKFTVTWDKNDHPLGNYVNEEIMGWSNKLIYDGMTYSKMIDGETVSNLKVRDVDSAIDYAIDSFSERLELTWTLPLHIKAHDSYWDGWRFDVDLVKVNGTPLGGDNKSSRNLAEEVWGKKDDKPSHRDKKVDASNPRVRLSGEEGSEVRRLRGELYTHAFEHINDAYDLGYYIECVTLLDSMITDRLDAYTQFLLHNEDKQYISESLHFSLKSFGSATKEKNVRDEEFKVIYQKINDWVPKRNIAIHNFVIVSSLTPEDGETRMSKVKETVDEGLKLVREVMAYTSKRIKIEPK